MRMTRRQPTGNSDPYSADTSPSPAARLFSMKLGSWSPRATEPAGVSLTQIFMIAKTLLLYAV
jgi:hypothetical protein